MGGDEWVNAPETDAEDPHVQHAYTLGFVSSVDSDWRRADLAGWMATGQAAKGRGRPETGLFASY